MKKAIIITLAIMLIGGFVLFSRHHNQQANEPLFKEVKNASSIKTAGVEQEMQTECTKAFFTSLISNEINLKYKHN